MKVLVTGAHGFIGGWVRAELEARGHECVPFDKPLLSILSVPQLREQMTGCDAVIHLAGVLGTTEILRGMHEAVRVNVTGTLNVLEVAAMFRIPVVQIGTGHKGQPNTYAITKACAEDLALARAQWLGEKIAVVRAFHVYGAGQKPPAPWGHSPVRKFFPTFACQALSGKPLEVYGTGRQVIDPVHASEVARVLVDAIGGPYGEVTEAGCGKPVTAHEAATAMLGASMFGLDTEVDYIVPESTFRYLPMRPGEPVDAHVVAAAPACSNPWPYKVAETLDWYRQFATEAV